MFPEASSAKHELVLSDQAMRVVAHAACTGVLAKLSGVTVELLGHLQWRWAGGD